MTDIRPEEDDGQFAAEYVLGTLPDAERKAFAARLARDAGLAKQVAYWESQLAHLNEDYQEVNPPPALRAAVRQRLFGAAEKPSGLLQSLGFWRGLSFAALAALALAVAVPLALKPAPQALSVAELALQQGSGVQLAAYFDAGSKSIRYSRISDAAPSGRDFELWVIIGKDAPISLGVVPADKSGTIKVAPELAAKMAEATLAITDEPKGGSPTGKATGSILSVGKLTPI